MARVIQGINVEKIWYGGIGLARMSDGKRILIKWGALPGTVVDLRVVKQRKDYIEAHITKIHRYDTALLDGKIFCPHFFSMLENNAARWTLHAEPSRKIGCGGCKRQMLSYATQLKLKQEIVVDSFKKLKMADLNILPIVGSPLEKWYRNKIEFSFGKYITNSETWAVNSEGKKELDVLSDRSIGFHKQWEFSKIVDIDNCGLISDQANAIFARIKELCKNSWLPVYDQKTHQGFFRHLVIREGFHTGQFLVNLSVADKNLKASQSKKRDQLLETLKKDELLKDKVTTFVITYNNGVADTINNKESETKTFRGDGCIYEKLIFDDAEISFRISPFSFFQTNTLGAEQLFSLAMHIAGRVEWTLLDIYCGTGSIWLSFLKAGKWSQLIGIEIVEEAITDARHNAKINGLEKQVLFVADPAEKALTNNPELQAKIKDIWLVILDPPRDGLHKNVIAFLGDLKKEQDFKLLYISCNPITMVRDMDMLATHGFKVQVIQPVDMFPQTHHIEVIGLLQ